MRVLFVLISLFSFGLNAEEYQPHGIPKGDSYKGYMTCVVIDVVVVGFKDGKTTRYSGIEDSFAVGDKMTLEVQYNTSAFIPEFKIKQIEKVVDFYGIDEIITANDEYKKYSSSMVLEGGMLSNISLNSIGKMTIDNSVFGYLEFNRYYKDDYEVSYDLVRLGELDQLIYFNCPNSGALTTAMDKMFDYVSKMPDNIESD